jgi:hypothetical protein
MTHVIMHTKSPQGWAQAKIAPINSKAWTDDDRSWFCWMLAHNSDVVTVGQTMYQLTTPKKKEA